ncbi:hypothetical protein CPB85DRAFT_1561433 [Mucidula mucida]|nr:hypothetical protein CPB85DRAFT_1561433 [Mucidula mucida]
MPPHFPAEDGYAYAYGLRGLLLSYDLASRTITTTQCFLTLLRFNNVSPGKLFPGVIVHKGRASQSGNYPTVCTHGHAPQVFIVFVVPLAFDHIPHIHWLALPPNTVDQIYTETNLMAPREIHWNNEFTIEGYTHEHAVATTIPSKRHRRPNNTAPKQTQARKPRVAKARAAHTTSVAENEYPVIVQRASNDSPDPDAASSLLAPALTMARPEGVSSAHSNGVAGPIPRAEAKEKRQRTLSHSNGFEDVGNEYPVIVQRGFNIDSPDPDAASSLLAPALTMAQPEGASSAHPNGVAGPIPRAGAKEKRQRTLSDSNGFEDVKKARREIEAGKGMERVVAATDELYLPSPDFQYSDAPLDAETQANLDFFIAHSSLGSAAAAEVDEANWCDPQDYTSSSIFDELSWEAFVEGFASGTWENMDEVVKDQVPF